MSEEKKNRRDFIVDNLSGLIISPLLVSAGCKKNSDDNRNVNPEPNADVARDPPAPKSRSVGIAKSGSRKSSIIDALELIGGLDFIKSGDSVFLKPNCVSADPYPFTTHPETIQVVAELVRDQGAKRIVLGDNSNALRTDKTLSNMQTLGWVEMAGRMDIELYTWDDITSSDLIKVERSEAPNWDNAASPGFSYPKILKEMDHIINLPCLKTHMISHVTIGLKNWLGFTLPSDRKSNLGFFHTMPKLTRQVADVCVAIKPALTILDATEAVIAGGPQASNLPATVKMLDIVVASRDIVALDVTGIALLKFAGSVDAGVTRYGVWNQPSIEAAVERRLGISGPDEYELIGKFEHLEEIINYVTG